MSASIKQKGRTRKEIAVLSMEKRIKVLAFVREHGPVSTTTVMQNFGLVRSVVSQWLRKMEETGHVEQFQERVTGPHGSSTTSFWSAGKNTEPLCEYAHGDAKPGPAKDPVIRRRIVPAKQCGMPAYRDLPMEFFGSLAQVPD